MAAVWIPPQLRYLTRGAERATVPGDTLRAVIDALDAAYPGLRDRLCEADEIRGHISIVVDGDVTQRGLTQPVRPDSEVQIIPAIAGG
ncbi:MAG: molybdopterin synthase sulfur carrier subunit [Dehalococcoidia bacterium]|nr:molybdopterin synthase sulfur carrier subunit [Dehalococcoidia bacterium]